VEVGGRARGVGREDKVSRGRGCKGVGQWRMGGGGGWTSMGRLGKGIQGGEEEGEWRKGKEEGEDGSVEGKRWRA